MTLPPVKLSILPTYFSNVDLQLWLFIKERFFSIKTYDKTISIKLNGILKPIEKLVYKQGIFDTFQDGLAHFELNS